MKYSEILRSESNKKKEEEPLIHEILSYGYSVLKKDKYNKTIIINPKSYTLNKEKKKLEKREKILNSMIDNWNNYRDSINDLYGDRSPYYNYKTIIQEMVDEDNIILQKLYEVTHNINISDDDNNSDDENNKQLIY